LHNPRTDVVNYADVVDFLDKLKKDGLIMLTGLSKAKGFDYQNFVDLQQFDVIQDDANLLYLEVIKGPKRARPTFMARSPLASGLLSDKITHDTVFSKDDHRSLWLKGERLLSLLRRVETIKKNTNLSLPRLAMRFLLHQENIDKIIFGVKKISHIDDIVQSIAEGPLESSLVEKLIKLHDDDFSLKNEKQYSY
jgi:aryl-alcohol dehydrogenase-like predicted oxidoreductase